MEAPVSVSLGVLRSLPSKLERLLSPAADCGLNKKEKEKIRLLKDHLQELMDKFLMEPSEVEIPNSTFRCWVKEVRELSYDIDDFLHELVHGHLADPKNLRRQSRWVADKCLQFKGRLRDAIKRHKTYNLDRCKKRPSSLASEDRPLPPAYGLATVPLVGIDRSMGKLEEWLIGDGDRNLRVLSVVGLGGVGKTTLAKELYCKIESQFECRAFARTARKPDIKKLLSSILLQVRPERPPDASESRNLINTIRAHLQYKKYFIIIDDLWASSTWDIICRALPDDKCCSRVVTTTEMDIVAQRCCGHNSEYILKMGPLQDDESRKLFFSRFRGDQSDISYESKVLFEVIRKCGGFPLATVTISGLLARQHCVEQLNLIRRSLSSNLTTNPSMEGMKQILDLCYNNLPDRLKACMLYLSAYKENHIISKDDLVKLWIAEGFICAKKGNSMEEVASTYLDELVNGGMVQPIDTNYNGEVLSCTVHYMILNIIRYKSIEENFITAIDVSQREIRLADKVRRLSLLFGDADDAEPPATLRLSQVRSLVFSGFLKYLPSIVEFVHLRVLILHLWGDQDNISLNLTTLCRLFGLKYLEIVSNVTLHLQTNIQGLRNLETLKIDSRVSEVPEDTVHLPGLLHLSIPGDTNLPNGIGRLATLRTLGCFDLTSNSSGNVMSLGELTNIWDLRLTCSGLQPDNLKENVEHLGSVLSKLRKLKSLTLLPAGSCNKITVETSTSSSDISYDLSNVSSVSTLLVKLELMPRICILSVLPKWIGKLRQLSILKIEVIGLSNSDIDVLQGLPSLTALSLHVSTAPAERIIFRTEGFPVLMHFVFICSVLCVDFEEGTMPNIRKLNVGFNANTIGKYRMQAGLQNLTGLEVFTAKIGGASADEFCRKVVKSELEDIFRQYMSPPIIKIQFVGWVFYGGKENSTASATQQQIAENGSFEDIVTDLRDLSVSYGDKEEISTLSATQQTAEEGSTEDIVTHLWEPSVCYGDKDASTELKTLQQTAERGSTEDIVTHLQDPVVSYGEKQIDTASATQQIAEKDYEDIVTCLQDLLLSYYGDKEHSITSAIHKAAEEDTTKDIVDYVCDLVFSYGDKKVCTEFPTLQPTVEGGSTEDIVTQLQDPVLSYGEKQISAASATQQIAQKDYEDIVADKELSTTSATHKGAGDGSTEDINTQLRDAVISYGDKEVNVVSEETTEEGSTKEIITLLPHTGDQEDVHHRTWSPSPSHMKEPDEPLRVDPPIPGHNLTGLRADMVPPELGAMEKYEVVKDLGAGDFCMARVMRNKETRELVAMTYIPRGEKIDENLFREIVNHRSLRHPNVIQFKEVMLTPTQLVIVTEYAAGGQLFEHICEAGRFHEDEARYLFQQLVCGVSYCHSMQICHRDLKLENMFLDGSLSPRLKICDIGYSKSSVLRSRPKSTVGSPAYIAPEVLSRREYDGKHADVWSCGVTLYTMLVGAYPFEDPKDPKNFRNTISKIMSVQYKIPENVHVSQNCCDLLSRIFVANPYKRITTKDIKSHPWFLKNLPRELKEEAQETYYTRQGGGQTSAGATYSAQQSVEEIMRIVQEAQTVPRPVSGYGWGAAYDNKQYDDRAQEQVEEEDNDGDKMVRQVEKRNPLDFSG